MSHSAATRTVDHVGTRIKMAARDGVAAIPMAPDIVYPVKVFTESKMQTGVFNPARVGALEMPDATPVHDQITNKLAIVADMWGAESRKLQTEMEKLGKNVTPSMLIKAQQCQMMYNQCFDGASNSQKKKEQCMQNITSNWK